MGRRAAPRRAPTTRSWSATATTGIRAGPEPAFPGEFSGTQIHAHDYRDPEEFRGKRVVVVGGGNSGMDIARDASHAADATYLSLRRGVHVIRKRLGRKDTPVDQTLAPPWLPWPIKQKGFEMLRRRSGNISDYGFPEPDHKIGHAHPTLSDQIHDRLADGAVRPSRTSASCAGDPGPVRGRIGGAGRR